MLIQMLDKRHDRREFDCGNDELNDFLISYALTKAQWDMGRTFVAVQSPDDPRVIAYYTLAMASLDSTSLSDALGDVLIPVVLMDRLAVDKEFQGRGIGGQMLVDALARAYRVSRTDIAARAVFVEAVDDCARDFYRHYGFRQLDDNPRSLFIAMKTIEQLGVD